MVVVIRVCLWLALGLFGVLCALAKTAAETSPITSVQDGLDFDENGKLSTHYVVFPAHRPDCPTHGFESGTERKHGYEARAVEGNALEHIFPHYGTGESYLGREHHGSDVRPEAGREDDRCLAACLEKGTDVAVAGHTMPHFHYAAAGGGSLTDFNNWFSETCSKVEVCMINYATKAPLEVFWVSLSGKRVKQVDLGYSEKKTNCFHSFVGHKFEAIDEPTGFYQMVEIGHITTIAFGTSPPSSSQRFDGIAEVEETVKGALDAEWKKHRQVARTFSSLGFSKGRLPKDVFANMGAFYYNNRHNAVNEEWEGKGVFVNWWETDVKFITVPWSLKKRWQLRLMELVSAWAGVPVEETSMYGLRQYETGARLLSHVDRRPTHAVSLIVNIAQDNLANPWPVEVFDHGDRLHEVTMEAGDIVYYESAKNLHSRNRPLTCKKGGCRFINLFTHYRPVNDGSAWSDNMDDMPNRPVPLTGMMVDFDADDSACVFSNETAADDHGINGDNVLGIGTVKCKDRRLGANISPTLFKAREADDLFRWWKATRNAHLVGFDRNKEAVYHPEAAVFAEAYEPPLTHRPEPANAAVAYDKHEECLKWAEAGDCDSNPDYMREHCQRSCDDLLTVVARKERDELPTHERCMLWAEEGECDKNPKYMLENCVRSCNDLLIAAEEARKEQDVQYGAGGDDTHEECHHWASRGECEKNPTYMLENCKKSCNKGGNMTEEDYKYDYAAKEDSDTGYDEGEDVKESGKDEL